MATGLLVTGTWGHYSMGALLWGWIGVPAAGAALAARLWPAARELWRRYSRVRQESRARLPVSLIGSPIDDANRLIGSPITPQGETGVPGPGSHTVAL